VLIHDSHPNPGTLHGATFHQLSELPIFNIGADGDVFHSLPREQRLWLEKHHANVRQTQLNAPDKFRGSLIWNEVTSAQNAKEIAQQGSEQPYQDDVIVYWIGTGRRYVILSLRPRRGRVKNMFQKLWFWKTTHVSSYIMDRLLIHPE
jgi:hypothetical protein